MTLEELAADVTALREQVPTLEDLLLSTVVPCWNNGLDKVSGATAFTLLVAPIPMRILSVALSFEYWSLPASDTNYWSVELNRGDAIKGYTAIATRTTQTTGANANGAITARKAWTFDAAAWASADLAAGDLLRMTAAPGGSPASDFDMPFTATIRYRPL